MRKLANTREAVVLLCCFSLCFFSVYDCLDIRTTMDDEHHTQKWERLARRNLGGPGSYPPRCDRKCGRCKPCHAVHVTVPPGTPQIAEYYPEAWRCKCGNRLYVP